MANETKAEEVWRCTDGDYIRNPKLGAGVAAEGIATLGTWIPSLTIAEARGFLAGVLLALINHDKDTVGGGAFRTALALQAKLPEEE